MKKKRIQTEKQETEIFSKIGGWIKDKVYDCRVFLSQRFAQKTPKKQVNARKSQRKSLIFYVGFFALPLLQLLIFYFAVNFNSFLLAFKRYDLKTFEFEWAGLENFRQIIYNFSLPGDILLVSLLNSLKLYAVNLLCGTTLSLLFSYYIYKKWKGSEFFRVVLFLPSIISSVVMVTMFRFFTDRGLPDMFKLLLGIKVEGFLTNVDTRFATILFYNVWAGFGTSILMYVSAMTRISPEIIESAALDGITPFREFFNIALPLIYPTITSFLIIGVSGIFISQGGIYEFFGRYLTDKSLSTLGYYLFVHVQNSDGFNNYAFASAAGILGTLISAPIVLLIKWLLEKFDPTAEV